MSVRFVLICVTAMIMMGSTISTADAQTVSYNSSGYQPANPPTQPVTLISPNGSFAVPMNMAGQYRVAVDYGILSNGAFAPYNPVPNGVPAASNSVAQNVGMTGGTFAWFITPANASGVDKKTQIRARLQQSTDNGVTWNFVGNSNLIAAIP